MTNSQRVIINTAALYINVVITAGLALFTSRFVLAALGVVDYGVYCVIAGIMGFMGFLNNAMATSSLRHLTHELGRGCIDQVGRIFNTCLFLHAILAALMFVAAETLGLWLLTHVLNIPDLRREAAFWVFQFTIVSAICYVLVVPFRALMIAHEAIPLNTLLAVTQSLMMFLFAIFIGHASGERLILYGAISSAVVVAVTLAQSVVCLLQYPEARLGTDKVQRKLMKDILSISWWNLFGAFSAVGRFQGLGLVLNMFFGPVVNAAYGVANQVSGAVSQYSQSVLGAVTPRLIKNEAAGNRERMLQLGLLSCKYVFLLATLVAIPLYVELPTVLSLWLKTPPEHSLCFCRIALLLFMVDQLSQGLGNVALATGRVARYQVLISLIHIATLPLAYGLLKFGFPPIAALLASLGTMVMASCWRPLVLRQLVGLHYRRWLREVVTPSLCAVLPSVVLACVATTLFAPSHARFFLLTPCLLLTTLAGVCFLGMARQERHHLFRNLVSMRFRTAAQTP